MIEDTLEFSDYLLPIPLSVGPTVEKIRRICSAVEQLINGLFVDNNAWQYGRAR